MFAIAPDIPKGFYMGRMFAIAPDIPKGFYMGRKFALTQLMAIFAFEKKEIQKKVNNSINPIHMAGTYTQLHIHCVFAVKRREALIDNTFKDELYEYITGIVQERGNKLLAIGGTSNHIHIFFGYRANESLSDLMKAVKRSSSLWVNQNHKTRCRFEWQEGYGAFSYSKSHVDAVINYIRNQEEHHKKRSFHDEYLKILNDFCVEYDNKYVFEDL